MQIFELKIIQLHPKKQELFDEYLKQAFIPTLNRWGVKAVGVYVEQSLASQPEAYYLLVPYDNAEQWSKVTNSLHTDMKYQKAAANYLAVQAIDPIYDRIESSLLRAFTTMPKLEIPTNKPQVYNLRFYESHNEAANQKKIEMFNQGELTIFRRVGLTPVFFGEAMAGARMPNLTYLLAFKDDSARVEAWKKFVDDPEWHKLSAIPEYEDKRIVSGIRNILLAPKSYSQI
jgi:hypothetical protein